MAASAERTPAKDTEGHDHSFANSLQKREYVWTLSGLSWLPLGIAQQEQTCTLSGVFEVDREDEDSSYVLAFSPKAESVIYDAPRDSYCDELQPYTYVDSTLRGTLALIRRKAYYGTNLDVAFFVKRSGEFQQWGERRRVVVPAVPSSDSYCFVIGPDLDELPSAKGVFGLPFDELLKSEWVQDDSITFKVAIEEIVMGQHPDVDGYVDVARTTAFAAPLPAIEMPPPTMSDDMIAMLTEGRHSDVAIEAVFEGAPPMRFTAHANILSQRSPVFAASLAHGMRESTTRTIIVSDVPPLVLKALLHFIYTDDVEQVRKVLQEENANGDAADISTAAPQHQAVLAAAHKYQVPRLLRWSEQQLCNGISDEMVCSLLGLAHLYEATALERNCLEYMQANMAEVVKRPEFSQLSPECLVKINLYCAGVEPAAQHVGGKRRRGE